MMKLPPQTAKNLIQRLTDKEEGDGWSVHLAKRSLAQYCNFLELLRFHPNEEIVPTRAIDEVWHYHILDTKSYMNWCERIFGQYIHHDPNFGRGSAIKKSKLLNAFERTKFLYEKQFGIPYVDESLGELSFCSATLCRTQTK